MSKALEELDVLSDFLMNAIAAEKNAIDEVIETAELRTTIVSALDVLSGKRVTRLSKKHSNMPL